MKKIKTALISVSDKKDLKPLLSCLKKNNIKIISSGGTYKEIKKLKFKCIEVSEFTNSPEILEGRVKTLHPKIHAGILKKRKSKMKNYYNLSKNNNLKQSAKNLYSVLRKIKNDGYKMIAVEKIQNKGIGKTINDRLNRASKY